MKKIILLFLIIAVSLTFIWFRGNSLLGGGEIGVQFYNLQQMVEISAVAWGDQVLGGSSGLTVAGAPLYLLFNLLQKVGIPGYILQAVLFMFLVFLTLFSSYCLSKEIFPKNSEKAHIASALFYFVNAYALVNIWNRFLQNPMIFYSFLPLGICLFLKGVRKRNYLYAVFTMILSAIFSYGFAGPSQTIIFWSLIVLFGIYYMFFIKNDRFVVYYFLLSIGLWFVFNFFWISQELYFRFSHSYIEASNFFFTDTGNLETFNAQSKVLGRISNLFLLRHAPFFKESVDLPFQWPLLYSSVIALLIQWIAVISLLWVAIRNRTQKWVGFLMLLFFSGIFVSKGNSFPLGDFLDILFKKISFLEFFRNPFEKLGLILPLSLSPLFGLLVDEIDKFGNKLRPAFKLGMKNLIWFYLILFLGLPFWTGLVFTSGNPPANDPKIGYQVEPPSYYVEADKYLSSQPGIFRFITFPLGGEGIFNTWAKGYAGVEQSGILFSTPSVSYNTNIPYYYSIVGQLERIFMTRTNFYEIARLMNIKYLVFRPDFDYRLSDMRNPETIENILLTTIEDGNSLLKHITDFGKLKIFKYDDSTFLPKIYAADTYIINNNTSYLSDVFFGEPLKKPAIYTVSEDSRGIDDIKGQESVKVVHSNNFFDIANPFPQEASELYIFPHVSVLPDSKFYPLILLKEKMILLTYSRVEAKANWELMMLGKRLKEAKTLIDKGDFKSAKYPLAIYKESLPTYLERVRSLSLTAKLPTERIWHEGEIFRAFSAHAYLFDELEKSGLNNDDYVSDLKKLVNEKLSEASILPVSEIVSNNSFTLNNRVVYQLKVFSSGEYEILIPTTKLFPSHFDLGDSLTLQIDNDFIQAQAVEKEKYVSFGKHYFNEGVHEIGFNQGERKNLIEENNLIEFDVNSEKTTKEVVIPFNVFEPHEAYTVSFDYKITAGSGFRFMIQQNVDKPRTKRRTQPEFFPPRDLVFNGYWHGWSNYQTLFVPQPYADGANLKVVVGPWDNCKEIFRNNSKKCEDESIRATYQLPTLISVRDMKILPNVPEEMILLQVNNKSLSTPEGITFERLNSTKYIVHIKEAKDPFILVFSELYNAGWEISGFRHFLINGFANGWWIDRTGSYDLTVEYKPQKLLNISYSISIFSIFLGLGYIVFKLVKFKLIR